MSDIGTGAYGAGASGAGTPGGLTGPDATTGTGGVTEGVKQKTEGVKQKAGETADTAKGHASDVAGHAKEQAGAVKQSAVQQAGQVLSEAETQAKDLLSQLRSQVDEQTMAQRDKLAAFLTQTGTELTQMGRSSEGSGMATQLVRQLGDRVSTMGDSLSGHQPVELLEQVRHYARRRPGAFLLGALAAGVLAGRVTRGAAAGAQTATTGRQLEPLSTAPAPVVDLSGTGVPSAGMRYGSTDTTQRYAAGGAGREDVDLYGEDSTEDLVPHHIPSDVPSMSDAPAHGSRP